MWYRRMLMNEMWPVSGRAVRCDVCKRTGDEDKPLFTIDRLMEKAYIVCTDCRIAKEGK